MSKMIDCAKVNPESGCGHVIQAETEEELLRKAAEHARNDHGLIPTPELLEQVRAHIQEV